MEPHRLLGQKVYQEVFGHRKSGRICSVDREGGEVHHVEVEWSDGSMTRTTLGKIVLKSE